MSYYKQCPTCGNNRDSEKVYVCEKCHHIFCDSCRESQCWGPLGLFTMSRCPICQSTDTRQIGRINND